MSSSSSSSNFIDVTYRIQNEGQEEDNQEINKLESSNYGNGDNNIINLLDILNDSIDETAAIKDNQDILENTDSNLKNIISNEDMCPECFNTRVVIKDGKAVRCFRCISDFSPVVNNINNEKVNKFEIEIPDRYKNSVFTPELILPPDNSYNFNGFLTTLKSIHGKILCGGLIDRSYLIFSFQGYGKQHWVYSCINNCLKNNLSVAPYMDTRELKYKILEGKLIDDYYRCDYVFIKIATGLLEYDDIQTMRLILDRRARNNRPTIIVSRYSKTFLLKKDKTLEGCIYSGDTGNLYEYSRLCYVPALGNSDK